MIFPPPRGSRTAPALAPASASTLATKRAFDLLFAASATVLLAPLFLAIAVWIRLDSPGPVLFRQQRVGRRGLLFRIHKFRTMRTGQAASALALTVGADPRITRAGRWLRASKLDELPQLLDVLVGTMSMVGPRPEVPRYVALYPPEVRAKVLSVRPGITDPAAIEYRDESALLAAAADPEKFYIEEVMPAKLRHSLRYVETMSVATDLRLIGATVRSVWLPRPAAPDGADER